MSDPAPLTGTVFDAHPDPMAVLDGDGVIVRTNPGWHPRDDIDDRCLAAILATGVGENLVTRVTRLDGPRAHGLSAALHEVLVRRRPRASTTLTGSGGDAPGLELDVVGIALPDGWRALVTVRSGWQAQARAQASEQRFHDLTESLDSVIFVSSPAHTKEHRRIHYISPSYERIWGRSRSTLVEDPMSFLEVVHPDDRDEVRRNLHRQAEGTWDREFRLRLDDGSERWIHSRAFPVRDADGEVREVVGIATDITARRQAEERVRRSREELELILDRIPVGIVMLRQERLVYANQAAAGYVGIGEPDPHLGRSVNEWIHPEDREGALERLNRMVESGTPLGPRELRVRHVGGRWITLDVAPVRVVELPDGPAVLFVIWDVSTQRGLTETLHRTQARYRAIFESSPVGIAVVTFEGVLRDANPALRHILGVGLDDDLPASALDLIHAGDRAVAAEALEGLAQARLDRHVQEALVRHADGDWRPVRLHASAAQGSGGAPALAVVLVEDVSERRELEGQLRQAQRIESVGRLAGGIAHDFNNLVTVITGHAEFLLDDLDVDDALKEDLREIQRAGERAAALTRQLLAFSRRTVMQPRVTDLNQVVGALTGMLGRTLGEDVRLEVDLDPALARVRVDPTQMEQVVMNLAVNARDAMPRGGLLRISTFNRRLDADFVRAHLGSVEGPHVALRVEDTGIGMDEEIRSHIFEPFFTTKEPGKGTGLGLAMIYGIVKQSGGYIVVESERERGSAFTVHLPAVDDPVSPEALADEDNRQGGGDETILLVEDEEGVRTLIQRILRSRGYRVLSAPEPLAALEILEHEHDIDLVVTDVVMPGMGGGELVERIRHRLPEVRVLFISGYADDDIVQHGVVAGEVPFLQKPFTGSDLVAEIRAILDDR